MKKMIQVEKTIAAPAAAVWATIVKGDGVDEWFPAISACRLDGDKRFCTMSGGGDLVETILDRDDATRTFRYSVDQHPLPVGRIMSSIRVSEAGSGASVSWEAEIEGDEPGLSETAQMMEQVYASGIEALETWHGEMA